MRRVRSHGKGKWVCTPKDFLDLGSRSAIDQALSRLVKVGKLRRLDHGFYDLPRDSAILQRPAPADLNAIIKAIVRRDGIQVMPDGIVAANKLGLTNAVPAKASYVTNGGTKTLKIGGRTIRLRHASPSVMGWVGRPAARVAQALRWLGPQAADDPQIVDMLQNRLSKDVKYDLAKRAQHLPAWTKPLIDKIVDEKRAVA